MPITIEIMIELTNQQEKMTQYCAPCVMLIIVILVKHMLHFFLIYVVFNERNEIRSALQVSLIHITLFYHYQLYLPLRGHSRGRAEVQQHLYSLLEHHQREGEHSIQIFIHNQHHPHYRHDLQYHHNLHH